MRTSIIRAFILYCILLCSTSITLGQNTKVYSIGDSLVYRCEMSAKFSFNNRFTDEIRYTESKGEYLLSLKFTSESSDTIFARAFIRNIDITHEEGLSLWEMHPDSTMGPWIYDSTELLIALLNSTGRFCYVNPVVPDSAFSRVLSPIQVTLAGTFAEFRKKEGAKPGDVWQNIVYTDNSFDFVTSRDTAYFSLLSRGVFDTLGVKGAVYHYITDSAKTGGYPYMKTTVPVDESYGTVIFDPANLNRMLYTHSFFESTSNFSYRMIAKTLGEEEGPNASRIAFVVHFSVEFKAKLLHES